MFCDPPVATLRIDSALAPSAASPAASTAAGIAAATAAVRLPGMQDSRDFKSFMVQSPL